MFKMHNTVDRDIFGQIQGFHGSTLSKFETDGAIILIGLLGKFVKEAYSEELEYYYADIEKEIETEMTPWQREDKERVERYTTNRLEEILGNRLVSYYALPQELSRSITAIRAQLNPNSRSLLALDKAGLKKIEKEGVLFGLSSLHNLFYYDGDEDRIYQFKEIDPEDLEDIKDTDSTIMSVGKTSYVLEEEHVERPLGAEGGDVFAIDAVYPDIAITGKALVEIVKDFTK